MANYWENIHLVTLIASELFTLHFITFTFSIRRLLASIGRTIRYLPGTGPIDVLQHKFYAMQFLKHFDWLKIISIQSNA